MVGELKPHFHLPVKSDPHGGEASGSFPEQGYRDFAGVIHVHTTYSHDADGTFEDVVRVANAQGLDYAITTEHNNLRALRDGRQGWHGTVLVLIGMEISTSSGHYVALNVTNEIDRSRFTPQQIIEEVARQGGLGFIAHPFFKKGRWRDWTVHGMTGMEIYNVAHDTLDENKARLALWTVFSPREPFYWSILDRPYDPLRTWDGLIRKHGKLVGIGAIDAHEFHALGLKFATYEDLFKLCHTHVLISSDALPDGKLAAGPLYEALARGHTYVSIDLVAPVRQFSWMAYDSARVLGIMGDDVPLTSGLQLRAQVPAPALLTVYRDGQPIDRTVSTNVHMSVHTPGAYRVEASRNGKPWIFSNPIYVTTSVAGQAVTTPPVPGPSRADALPSTEPAAPPVPGPLPSRL